MLQKQPEKQLWPHKTALQRYNLRNLMADSNEKSVLLAYVALGIGVVCIGFSGIFVKIAGAPGVVYAFYRVLIAGIGIVPWGILRQVKRPASKETILIATGGIFFALDLALWHTSLLLTSAATATLLANNAPLWVGLGALLLFREQLTLRYWCGLMLSIVGMAILVGATSWSGLQLNVGDLLAIAASGFYAAYILTTQRARVHVDTLTFMTISLVSTIPVLLILNLAMGTALTGYPAKTWLALIGLGLVSHMGGWLAINYALGHLRAAPVSVTLLGQVIVTALLSIPLLGETLSRHQILGGMVVLGGIYLANQGKGSKPETTQTSTTTRQSKG
jgi:drug/metabolite transporter (DMT)-like permease